MNKIESILNLYKVDLHRGFLPALDPITRLPESYTSWEKIAKEFTPLINAGVIREHLETMDIIDVSTLDDARMLERAMLLLSFFAHAYIHLPPVNKNYLPESIAIPWIQVANKLQRKPILSHSSIVLYNWRRINPNDGIHTGNLATLFQFHGGIDESWFYLITVEIEQVGATAIPIMLEAIQSINEERYDKAEEDLRKINEVLDQLTKVLQKMYIHCDPHTFYLRIRPFLMSFEKIEYRGTGLPLQSHHGGSAAQSSLLQFFDAALGLEYSNAATTGYLRLMRQHMPAEHAAFLEYIERNTNIKNAAASNPKLSVAYEEAIAQLIVFRNEHMKIVALYVMKQAQKTKAEATGTGGTNPMHFLKSVRNDNESVIKKK